VSPRTIEEEKKLAFEAAKEYAQAVSIGNLTALRRFLETSLRRSGIPSMYLERFAEGMLTKAGRDEYLQAMRRVFGKMFSLFQIESPQNAAYSRYGIGSGSKLVDAGQRLDAAIAITMGYTRKRKLLIPAWADDKNLWK